MASLTGQQINNTYGGLLKTADNGAISGGRKNITDGAGNTTPLNLGNGDMEITGTTLFSNASVDYTNCTRRFHIFNSTWSTFISWCSRHVLYY